MSATRRDFIKTATVAATLGTVGLHPAPGTAKTTAVPDKIEPRARPFPPHRVELLEGPFREARERTRRYLMSIPNDRLLHSFRLTAGLPSSAQPLGGWESPHCEIRGHFSGGHYLSACALQVGSTGDEALREKADALVAGLARCQRDDGYLGAYPSEFYERLARREGVWVPLYTGHKLVAGQLDMARLCGNAQSLEIATRFADWIGAWMDGIDDAQWQRVLEVEFGAVHESFWELYRLHGDDRYRRWARRFEQPGLLQPLDEGSDALDGLHANTQAPKLVAAARAYEIDGEPRDRRVAENFWSIVTGHHAYATGGVSDYELFGQPDHLAGRLSGHSHESCCSYNLLKLTRHLHGWEPRAALMDYYERVLFNARLGTQDEAGMMMYFVPMDAGYWKVFNTPFDSFWCCTGTGVEEFSKVQDTIYFHDGDALSVDLFIASRLDWAEQGVRVTQQTRFPQERGTTLRFELHRPRELALRLRIPSWTNGEAALRVNGEPVAATLKAGTYFELRRRFADGDRIELDLPMALHAAPLADEPSLQAMMYGPLVLAARMGSEGVRADQIHVSDHRPSLNRIVGRQIPSVFFAPEESWARPLDETHLRFTADGIDGPLELVPLYRIGRERYAVYCRARPEWEKNPQF